jgi:hypothetical protein
VTEASTSAAKTKESASKNGAASAGGGNQYQLPFVGVRVPAQLVDVGFWGGLTGAAVLGAIDPPLAILVGAGVVVARHQAKKQ